MKNEIIPASQHGLQKSKSTMTALISMVDSWQEALERGESVGVLLFDLSAAFDTLDPPLLEIIPAKKHGASSAHNIFLPASQDAGNRIGYVKQILFQST
jgi:hypothetical protein